MPAPTFTLATAGGDPSVATKGNLEQQINYGFAYLHGVANPEDRIRAEDAANIAVTQAGLAKEDRVAAAASRDQSALNAIAAGAPLYDTVEAGLAAVADRGYFLVMSKRNLQLHQRQGAAATALGFVGRIVFDAVSDLPDLTYDDVAGGYRVEAEGFPYEVAASDDAAVPDDPLDFRASGGVKLKALPIVGWFYNAMAFGAKGNGARDAASVEAETKAVQACINAAARDDVREIFYPAKHFVVDTLYGYYDATLNPDYPSDVHRNGRITFKGARAADLTQLYYLSDYDGTIIETINPAGPALKLGNGASADATTARRIDVENIAFLGVCTGSILELDGAAQHTRLENLSIYNNGGVGGHGLYIHNGFYAATVRNVHVAASGGTGVRAETASLCIFDTVNSSNSATAWHLGLEATNDDDARFGTGSTFINCQGRNSGNGLLIQGAKSTTFIGWWLEHNESSYDIKITDNSMGLTFIGMYMVSTLITTASVVLGNNTGISCRDRCSGIEFITPTFFYIGSANYGVLRYAGCEDVTIRKPAFKSNGGKAIAIDTSGPIKPFILEQPNWDPPGAGAEFGIGNRVVELSSGTSMPHLVDGAGTQATISADLDMTAWKRLPSFITASTIGGNLNVTLPSDCSSFEGKVMAVRKAGAANTLTITGSIDGATSISATANETVLKVMALSGGRYTQL